MTDSGRSLSGHATAAEPKVSALRDGIVSAEARDAILMEVAGWVEEGDPLMIAGIMAKRKRVREDAALRIETSQVVLKRAAEMIRARMGNKVGDPVEFLQDVKAGRHDRYVTGYILREAISLADKGLLKVCALSQVAGPWNNTIDGVTEYKITLTKDGEEYLAKAMETGTAKTAGLGAAHDSAASVGSLPETTPKDTLHDTQ